MTNCLTSVRGEPPPDAMRTYSIAVIPGDGIGREYSEAGRRLSRGTANEMAIQEAVFTRRGVERIARYALQTARRRGGRLASATKSNGIVYTMPFWDEIVAEVAGGFDDVELARHHAAALAGLPQRIMSRVHECSPSHG